MCGMLGVPARVRLLPKICQGTSLQEQFRVRVSVPAAPEIRPPEANSRWMLAGKVTSTEVVICEGMIRVFSAEPMAVTAAESEAYSVTDTRPSRVE